ncbi:MAG TPA: hypothetical protein VNU01_12620 [Egibacteraceae bacterium]|nr:hypothetical protein [Egibacteraceae bacterium]
MTDPYGPCPICKAEWVEEGPCGACGEFFTDCYGWVENPADPDDLVQSHPPISWASPALTAPGGDTCPFCCPDGRAA